jgi:hypothetical protein
LASNAIWKEEERVWKIFQNGHVHALFKCVRAVLNFWMGDKEDRNVLNGGEEEEEEDPDEEKMLLCEEFLEISSE